ncbi:hypothetical protein BHE74_00011787 [Ensete ventricosum]|uniref:Uncharacterized protein n=1 Tax=Ensete ventricosum TaxID=4639 RepID=A0A445MG42_ENSVE|nr:hypothetical protein BHE74_00011787 [Ensete ventricosum]RZR73168.1 hypothetical protein BHM03_00020984 [Ensete ventricosum]
MDHLRLYGFSGGSVGEDEVRGNGDEDAQEEGLRDHCVPNVRLINAHPPEAGPEALQLIVNAGEVVCVQCPVRQQQLDAAASGRFHDASSRH